MNLDELQQTAVEAKALQVRVDEARAGVEAAEQQVSLAKQELDRREKALAEITSRFKGKEGGVLRELVGLTEKTPEGKAEK